MGQMARWAGWMCLGLCAGGRVSAAAGLDARIAHLEQRITTLNANLGCMVDEHCVVLPIGHKQCGGPRKFLVVSNRNKDFKAVLKATRELEKLERHQSGFSTCDGPAQPHGQCMENTCRGVIPTRVKSRGVHGLPGLVIDETTRIQTPEEFNALWNKWVEQKGEKPENWLVPAVDFSSDELLAGLWLTRGG